MKSSNIYSANLAATTTNQTVNLPAGSVEVLIVNDSTTISAYIALKGGTATSNDMELKPEEVLVLSGFCTTAISYLSTSATANLRLLVLY